MTYFTVFGLFSLKSDVPFTLVSAVLDKSKSLFTSVGRELSKQSLSIRSFEY